MTIIHREQKNRRSGDALTTILNSNSNPNYVSLLRSLGLFLFPIDKFRNNKPNVPRLLTVRHVDLSFEITLSHKIGKGEGKKVNFAQ
jgi:hypothetical protein